MVIKPRTIAFSAALAAALAFTPLAAMAIDDAAYLDAVALLQKAQASQQDAAIGAAVERWRALLAAEPTNPLLRAHAGAAVALQATTTMLPWRKMGYAEDGLALIDKALAQLGAEHDAQLVAGTPVALLTRFTSASTFIALPGFFNRGVRGEDLLAAVQKHPAFLTAPLPFRGSVWVTAARHAAKGGHKDEARRLLALVTQSGAPQADAALKLQGAL